MGENHLEILILVELLRPFRTDKQSEPPSRLNAGFSMQALPLHNTVMFYVIPNAHAEN